MGIDKAKLQDMIGQSASEGRTEGTVAKVETEGRRAFAVLDTTDERGREQRIDVTGMVQGE